MTEPGHVAPASAGWWVRTNRVGVNANEYGFAVSATGSRTSRGTAAGAYGWAGLAAGVRRVLQFVGANATAGTSGTIPTHAVGDIIVLFVYAGNIATPTLDKPTAALTVPNWNYIDHATGANVNESTTAYFVATGTHTTGTWTNATDMIAAVIRGQTASPIGGHAESGAMAAGSATAPSITMTHTDTTSFLLHFFGHRAGTGFTAWSAAPAGYTQRAAVAGADAVDSGACLITKDDTSSDGAVTNNINGSQNNGYRGATVEILYH